MIALTSAHVDRRRVTLDVSVEVATNEVSQRLAEPLACWPLAHNRLNGPDKLAVSMLFFLFHFCQPSLTQRSGTPVHQN